MCRFLKYGLPLVAFVVSSLLFAGGADCHKGAVGAGNTAEHKKCNMSADECKKMMADAKGRGWLGLKLDENEEGEMVIQEVVASSPAEKAGFRAGDVLLSLNGVTLKGGNDEKLHAMKKNWKPGAEVTYNVRRGDQEQNIAAKLAKMPDTVYTTMVAEHMKEHAEVASAK